MTYIMAFHPDNVIRRNGKQDVSLVDFKAANPFVPLIDGQFFQLDEDRLIIMNAQGQGNEVDMADNVVLIDSIKNPPIPAATKVYSSDAVIDAYLALDVMESSAQTGDGIAVSFTVKNGVQVWKYRVKNDAELIIDTNNIVLQEISRLESEVTQRRMRDSILGVDGGWMQAQEDLISVERNKLQ